MKRLLIISLLLVSCSKDSGTTIQSNSNQNCTVYQSNTIVYISCTDGSTVSFPLGTVITPVQFCPGTTSYPGEFNEVGFCINNNLYAVYSANNGFLTYIPNGYYNSNAIGSSCNFYVNSNCVISY
jgi:hypothetical protein